MRVLTKVEGEIPPGGAPAGRSALKQNSWIDHAVRTSAIAGIATPSFWLGIVAILIVLDRSYAAFGAP